MNAILKPFGFEVHTLLDYPEAIEVVEDGDSFLSNATKKAAEQAKHLKKWVIAEDSGLSVSWLKGEPGIYSARFSGPHATDEDNNNLLLKKLENVPLEKRGAWYTCAMVVSDPEGHICFSTEGQCHGRILFQRNGVNGFGYDPLFEVIEYHKTFGELAPIIKSVISHRARATRQLISFLIK